MKIIFVISLINIFLTTVELVKVCKNFNDYYNVFAGDNCYNNPDSDGNVTEIVARWGFSSKQYNLITDDGYELTIFRIISNTNRQYPVLLAHGIYMNCLALMDTGNKSLAHNFAINGYDVWLANFRGTKFSNGHVSLNPNGNKYWDFSFHEMGTKDLPKMIDLINEETGKKVIFIGFSMGTTISYIYSSMYPEVAKKSLVGIISLAPVAYLSHIRSIVNEVAYIWPFLDRPFNFLFRGKVLSDKNYLRYLCIIFPFQMKFCELLKTPIFGYSVNQIDPVTYPVTGTLNTEAISIKTITHYLQIVRKFKFQQFDYGKKKNFAKYGTKNPPIYNLNNIKVPVKLYVGPGDWLATANNAEKIYGQLTPTVKCGYHLIDYKTFSHGDFVLAKDIVPLVTENVLKSAKNLENGICGEDI